MKTENPDVIILDIQMPQMDGFEVCKIVKSDENLSNIPVILITASKTCSVDRAKGLKLGADSFISKPIDEVELIAQIKVALRIKEYEVYEIKWLGEKGWATNARGCGYHNAVGAYSELVEHLHANYFDNPNRVFANGNSGGAVQIAYGLAKYNLENILTMVVLSGGPPISDLQNGIFCDGSEPICWPDGIGGFIFTDYLMAWDGNGDYCYHREAPEYIQAQLDPVSLITSLDFRDYHYSTFVNFVQSDDEINADHQAELYFDEITSQKDWHFLDSITEHSIPGTYLGAQKIQELILNFEEHIYGDVDGNGQIQAIDASLTLQNVVDLIDFTEEQIMLADVDVNGEIQAYDASLILQFVVGLIDEFPVE